MSGAYSILDEADELRTRRKEEPCPDCRGTGSVQVHVCRNDRECAKTCPQEQQCMACLGQGNMRILRPNR